MYKCLITGATGFVGRALVEYMIRKGGFRIAVACRDKWYEFPPEIEGHFGLECSGLTDWSSVLGVDCIVHLAARVHIMNDQTADPLGEFRRVNVDGTLHLAKQAAVAGVKRFVFLSSVKVNGEKSERGQPIVADQEPNPGDPYGISKMEAEEGLRALARETGMEVVIIRPPLVYGQGVRANFLAMMRWLWRGIPLPLGAVTTNKRSLVALDNLVDFIATCVDHPAAANQVFLVSDGEDLSTAALLQRMGRALGRPARLIPVPVGLLTFGATLLGRSGVAQRLCGSLEVDISKTRELLGWVPPVSVDEGLRRTAAHWLESQQASCG